MRKVWNPQRRRFLEAAVVAGVAGRRHGQMPRASCADCHPRLSNCGLDVEKMDTTFLSASSEHNIHFVKCIDCHPKGVPPKRSRATPRGGEGHAPGCPAGVVTCS